MTLRLSYVLPVHNQAHVLSESVAKLRDHLRAFPGSEVLLIENGSSDGSASLAEGLASNHTTDGVGVRAVQSARGMGYALRRGLELADGDVIVLTAADLPFGFTDLDAYLSASPRPQLAIGSKAHPHSRIEISQQRRILSEGFRLLRLLVLGMRVRDSQGTLLIERQTARTLLPHLRSADFLISTEIVCWAARCGVSAVELPVEYTATGTSTVSPVRDSLQMAFGLLVLRRRLSRS